MGFETPQLKLTELLEDVRTGAIQLPDFQRGYKWDDQRIRELLVTVLRGHPMGALMQLVHGDDAGVRFKPQPLARVADDAAGDHRVVEEPEVLLLDGQQRMTSMYQALMGSGVVATKDSRGARLSRRYFLDVEKALGDPSEQDEAVLSVPADGRITANFGRDVIRDYSDRAQQLEHGVMPFTTLFDGTDTQWFFDYVATGDRDQRFAVFQNFSNSVTGRVRGYVVPAIRLDKQTTREAVATVFEKVNSGGLRLDNFELLTAIFAGDRDYFQAHGDDFRLAEDWAKHHAALAAHPVLADVGSIDFLQAVLLLATLERRQSDLAAGRAKPRAVSARGEDVLKLTLTEYLRWAPRVRQGFLWAAGFYLREHIHTSKFLPYRTQTVPLAVFRVIIGERIDTYAILERIRRWYWCGVLGELYGSTTETRFARDVEQVPDWACAATGQGGVQPLEPRTVVEAGFAETRLYSLRTRGSAAYKGIYALLMKQGARDWKLDQQIDHATYLDQQIDIHHIFPKAWCESEGIDPNDRESIVNKTPLAKKTNISLRGDSPSVYLPRLERDSGLDSERLDGLLRGHLIDPATLRRADFDAFFDARHEALVQMVEEAMGKRVHRDAERDESGQVHGSEVPDAFEPEPEDTDEEIA